MPCASCGRKARFESILYLYCRTCRVHICHRCMTNPNRLPGRRARSFLRNRGYDPRCPTCGKRGKVGRSWFSVTCILLVMIWLVLLVGGALEETIRHGREERAWDEMDMVPFEDAVPGFYVKVAGRIDSPEERVIHGYISEDGRRIIHHTNFNLTYHHERILVNTSGVTLILFESEERVYQSGDLAFVAGTVLEENGTRYMMADVIVYDLEIFSGNFESLRAAKRCFLFLIVSASMIQFLLHVPVRSAGNRIVPDDAHDAQPGAVPGRDGGGHPLPAPDGEHGSSSTDGAVGSVTGSETGSVTGSGSSVSRKVPQGPRYCPLPPGTPRNMIGSLRSITVILGILLVIVATAVMLLLVLWNLDVHGIHSSLPPGLPADATERAEVIYHLQALPMYLMFAFFVPFYLYETHAGIIRISTEGLS